MSTVFRCPRRRWPAPAAPEEACAFAHSPMQGHVETTDPATVKRSYKLKLTD